MTKHRMWIPVLIVLAVLLAGAGVWYFSAAARQSEAAELAHDVVLERYTQLVQNAEATTLSVTEKGVQTGTFTLRELGVLDATLASIDAAYSGTDRMSREIFAALPLREKKAWQQSEHPENVRVPVEMEGFSAGIVLTALNAQPRTAAQNAEVRFDGRVFTVADAVSGTQLREDVVADAVRQRVSELVISENAPDAAKLEITELDCYVQPEVTAETLEFDPQALFSERLGQTQITVGFFDETLTLDGDTLRALVSYDEEAGIQADAAALTAQIAQWAERYDRYQTDYIFDSFLEGEIPIPFLTVDYRLNQEALCAELLPLLEQMESGSVEAEFSCTRDGQPFAIESSYIEVDITNQHMAYFQDGELVVDTDIVTGSPYVSATPRGLYYSFYKCEDAWLSGPTWLDFVDYWVSVSQDSSIGLHDADWQEQFGGDVYMTKGSHGCVNTPKEAMKVLYERINVEDHIPILIYHQPNDGF